MVEVILEGAVICLFIMLAGFFVVHFHATSSVNLFKKKIETAGKHGHLVPSDKCCPKCYAHGKTVDLQTIGYKCEECEQVYKAVPDKDTGLDLLVPVSSRVRARAGKGAAISAKKLVGAIKDGKEA